jgi:uncharacterized membrane protein YtjA (UPF0391 family)
MRGLSLAFYMQGWPEVRTAATAGFNADYAPCAKGNSQSGSASVDPQPPEFNSPLWPRACTYSSRRSNQMLWTICVILLVMWALGMATAYTAGGLIHILLVIGLIVLVIRLIQGRRLVT